MALNYTETACLRYLSIGLMEATGQMIGETIARAPGRTPRGYMIMGNRTARQLRSKGLVKYLPDLDAWRITPRGREVLQRMQP